VDYVDTPRNEEEREKFTALAEALACVIQETQCAQDPESLPKERNGMGDQLEEDEAWGPKITALPEEFEDLHEGEDVAQLVNQGPDVPEHLHPKLDEVLHRNAAMFGVRGYLGHVKEKAPILLKPGMEPTISMYAA
jgi:hypothetical protein